MGDPNPVDEVVRPADPKREQKVLTEPEMRRLVETPARSSCARWCAASASSRCGSARRPDFRSRRTTLSSGRCESGSRPPRSASPSRCAWLGTVERLVPIAFACIYAAELIRQAT
jgi:hypothetical protein